MAWGGRVLVTEMTKIVAEQPRARGFARLSFVQSDKKSRLADLRQSGSTRVLFPRVDSPVPQAVLINTAGGLTGGDRFETQAEIGPGAALTLTTQAAERAYLAQPGEHAEVANSLKVGAGGRANWLPQETILFQGCSLSRHLRVDLADGARALITEPLVFGRAAMRERVLDARFSDRIEIRRNEEVLFLDSVAFAGDVDAHLAKPTIADGAKAMAGVIYVAPDAEARLDAVRAHLPQSAGASLIRDGLLFCRILASDSYILRRALVPVLAHLLNDDLPRPWMI